jgi:hypothetical protein
MTRSRRPATSFASWWDLTTSIAMAGLEAQRVVGLRLQKLAAGGAQAQTEAQLMFTEKIAAGAEAVATLASGGSASSVVRRYRTIIRANEKRLNRG